MYTQAKLFRKARDRKGSIMKLVELWKNEGSGLLLLCMAVLLTATNTSSRARLSRVGCSVLANIVS
jgi:hypothetical protein